MNELIEKARKKIEEEITNSNEFYVKVIGEYLLKHIDVNTDAAKNITTADKTIVKSLEKVKEVAKKKAVNGCAILEDEEVFKLVREYFGFEAVQDKILQVEIEEIKQESDIAEREEKQEKIDFDYSLDDFM